MFRNSAFSSKKSTMTGNDYLSSKKATMIYYSKDSNKRLTSYQNVDLYNKGIYLQDVIDKKVLPFNKSDLEVNLHSYYDLSNVNVIKPTNMLLEVKQKCPDYSGNGLNFNTMVPFYYYYKIDPNRKIFKEPCNAHVSQETDKYTN